MRAEVLFHQAKATDEFTTHLARRSSCHVWSIGLHTSGRGRYAPLARLEISAAGAGSAFTLSDADRLRARWDARTWPRQVALSVNIQHCVAMT